MAISEHLNQCRLKEILENIYITGQEAENIQIKDVIEDIKRQVLAETK